MLRHRLKPHRIDERIAVPPASFFERHDRINHPNVPPHRDSLSSTATASPLRERHCVET
jgi:hypothetical protein